VTVALSGEGADELFAGYRIYQYMLWLERYRRTVPSSVRSALVEPIARTLPSVRLRKYLEMSRHPLAARYLGVGVSEPWQRASLYSAGMRAEAAGAPGPDVLGAYYHRSQGQDALSRMLYLDLKTWLVDDLLIKADKMTMANAVELRVPFLDHRVVEFAATVPSNVKLRRGSAKWILKKAMAARLPPEILRRRKVGFPTPLERMFRSAMAGYLRDRLLSPRAIARGYFDPAQVSRLVAEHVSGSSDHHRILWKLVVLEEWHRSFIDARPGLSNPAAPGQMLDGVAV
jgi:asparagine synthase (glutamine-hydrolysing)